MRPRRSTVIAVLVAIWPAAARGDEADRPIDPDCLRRARTRRQLEACFKDEGPPEEVRVRAKPPPRSASDWEVDDKTIQATPHDSAADTLNVVPGVFVSDRGLPGRAPHLSLRGFDGTSGQDVEIYAGNIPLNQVTHLRAPGYADMRLIPPEVIRAIRVSHGPYDPRQGDFAVAGSMHMDLGLERPGFRGKAGVGSFGSRRVLLSFAPEEKGMRDTFAAFETDATDGPGGARAGERSSFVGQIGGGEEKVEFHATLAIGSARFDFPGFLPQAFVERGGYSYTALRPLGRDRTKQTLGGVQVTFKLGEGSVGLGVFSGRSKSQFLQNLTGFALDPAAGRPVTAPDTSEQVNDTSTLGLSMMYRHGVELTSKRDSIEAGAYARADEIEQSDIRLFDDGTRNQTFVDATVDATNVGGYADLSLHPIKRVVVRGGARLDSLSYGIKDRAGDQALERTAQGFNLGNKATVDVAAGAGTHLLASYGEGFRSPQARDLREGDRVPFARVRGLEAGARLKPSNEVLASAVGFASWLTNDRVFDATSRANLQAPPSRRVGGSVATTFRKGPFGSSASATYTYATFTASDARFQEGDRVPYAPAFVVRDDAWVGGRLGRLGGRRVTWRVGLGVEGVADRKLPGGRDGQNVVYVDGVAVLGWREVELALNGTNLLGLRYYDSQYVYASNFERSPVVPAPAPHVLVAAPTTIFLTLQVHLRPSKSEREQREEKACLRRAKTDDEEDDCREAREADPKD